ncbi:MAG: hypothetical protein RLZZ505_2049 [Verrucomicrobiota bacterium]|jgi:hypothetical protein
MPGNIHHPMKTEAGQGGKRGHSNMTHWDRTEILKAESRTARRREGNHFIRAEMDECDPELSSRQNSAEPKNSKGTNVEQTSRTAFQRLELYDQNIREKISAFERDSAILGLLDVTKEEQEAISATLIELSNASLVGLLSRYPAATAYGLALVRATSEDNLREFWPCFENGMQRTIPSGDRTDLSVAFQKACHILGLRIGEIGERRNIAPFLFQAGIIHCWELDGRSYLTSAYRAAFNHQQYLPSSDDVTGCNQFSKVLATHCHHSKNLKDILESEVGGMLVSRLVSFYQGDEAALPEHLRKAFAAEKSTGRNRILPRPHLAYDPFDESLVMVLPAVPPAMADEKTVWRVDGVSRWARHEVVIRIDAEARNYKIELDGLRDGKAALPFELESGFNETTPFRIFQYGTGKETRTRAGDVISLTPGAYHVLTHPEAEGGSDDECFVRKNGFRVCAFHGDVPSVASLPEFRPGDPAVNLSFRGRKISLTCEFRNQFYFGGLGGSLLLDDGSRLCWGEQAGLRLWLHDKGESHAMLRIGSEESPIRISPSTGESALRESVVLDEIITNHTRMREPGIHRIVLKAKWGDRTVASEIYYWKGLSEVDERRGFHLVEFPGNVDLAKSVGLKKQGDDLVFEGGMKCPHVQIRLNDGTTLSLKRPGIRCEQFSPDDPEAHSIQHNEELIALKSDRRRIRFSSGGFEVWKILCNGEHVVSLSPTRTVEVVSLASLSLMFQGHGKVWAENAGGAKVHLFRIRRPLSTQRPHPKTEGNYDRWSINLPMAELYEVGVRIRNLGDDLTCRQSGYVKSIALRRTVEEPGDVTDELFDDIKMDLGEGIAVHAKPNRHKDQSSLRVSLQIDRDIIPQGFYFLDLVHRASSREEWDFVHAREEHGYSKLRFPVFGVTRMPEGEPWWMYLFGARKPKGGKVDAEVNAKLSAMSDDEIRDALRLCRDVLNFQYPSTVWSSGESRHCAVWLENWPWILAASRQPFTTADHSAWWQEGIHELAEFSQMREHAKVKLFLFGIAPQVLLRLAGVESPDSEETVGRLESSLMLGVKIQSIGGLIEFAKSEIFEQSPSINLNCFSAFERWSFVKSSGSGDLGSFDFQNFLSSLGEPNFDAEKDGLLLSPSHLLEAVVKLNGRTRILAQTSQQENRRDLRWLTIGLEAVQRNVESAAIFIKERAGIRMEFRGPAGNFNAYWVPPGLANEDSRRLANMIWCVAGLCRLAAHGKANESEASSRLEKLLSFPNKPGEGLTVSQLFSFGPELFAFYVALFDLAFSPSNIS